MSNLLVGRLLPLHALPFQSRYWRDCKNDLIRLECFHSTWNWRTNASMSSWRDFRFVVGRLPVTWLLHDCLVVKLPWLVCASCTYRDWVGCVLSFSCLKSRCSSQKPLFGRNARLLYLTSCVFAISEKQHHHVRQRNENGGFATWFLPLVANKQEAMIIMWETK